MPRIRSIKPEFWTDDKILDLSIPARLFFIGLWNFADDNGVLENKPKQLKARIFPVDDLDITSLIQELYEIGLVQTYSVNGCNYLQVKNFRKHQAIDKPRKSLLPLPLPEDSSDFNGNQQISNEINGNQLKSGEISPGKGKGKGKGRGRGSGKGKGKGRGGGVGEGKQNLAGNEEPPDTQTRPSRSARKNEPEEISPPVFSCRHFEVDPDWFEHLLADYPALNREALVFELKKMADWLDDNPDRHKRRASGRLKNPKLFVRNWLARVVVPPHTGRPPPQIISPAMAGPLAWLNSKIGGKEEDGQEGSETICGGHDGPGGGV